MKKDDRTDYHIDAVIEVLVECLLPPILMILGAAVLIGIFLLVAKCAF